MHLSVPCFIRASLVAQMVKNLPAVRETWVRSLGWEDTLEEGVALQYSFLENPHGQGAWSELPCLQVLTAGTLVLRT